MLGKPLVTALALVALHCHAQNDAAARSLAATCASCHGTDGRSVTQEVASLAGLPKDYLVAQMKAFRDGARAATVMPQIAKGYSDAQIELVADYLSRRPR